MVVKIVVKIVVPLILIIYGAISFGQSLIDGKDENVKKHVKDFIIKIIGAIIIFLLPSIINMVMALVNDINETNNNDYELCSKCLVEPKKC